MKIPPYPLGAALDLRQRRRDAARRFLADRLHDLTQAERRFRQLETRRRALEAERLSAGSELYRTSRDGRVGIGEIVRRRQSFDFLKRQIQEVDAELGRQQQRILEEETKVETARRHLLEAARLLKTIERHRGDWMQQQLLEVRRQEERSLQEVANAAFVARTHQGALER